MSATINTLNKPATEKPGAANQCRVGIAGGAGYTGGELLRLLVHHSYANISFVHSRSNAGKKLHEVHPDLIGESDILFTDDSEAFNDEIDVLFLCLGHGESRKFLQDNPVAKTTSIIDLSQDFRLSASAEFEERHFIYGLPELNKEKIRSAKNIANPGCFATSIELGLLPLAKEGLLNEVYTTGITGSTGAGQSLSATSHFSWRANNIQAYKTLTHQHLKEVYQTINVLQKSFPAQPGVEENNGINFVPWRGDFTRGIFISSTITCDWKLSELVELYEDFYAEHPFTFINQKEVFLKQVVNTNKCVLQLERAGSKLVVHSAIDNLLKGASGQAIQNMNLMMGWEEHAGLQLKASAF